MFRETAKRAHFLPQKCRCGCFPHPHDPAGWVPETLVSDPWPVGKALSPAWGTSMTSPDTEKMDVNLEWGAFLFKDFIYLFLDRVREGEREISMCGCFLSAPCWGPGLQPRPVP